MKETKIANSQRDGEYVQTDSASVLEDMPTYEEHMAKSDNTNMELQGKIDISKYTTSKETREAIKTLEQQLSWKKISSDLVNAMESGPLDETDNHGTPAWMRRFTTGSREYTWPPERGYTYRIKKIVSDDGQREKIIIEPDYGYAEFVFQDEPIINVNGFTRLKSSKPFIEETDFTFENNKNNESIPERMNKVLLDLFSGAFDKDNKRYPDFMTVSNAYSELKEIIHEIDGGDLLNGKKEKLKDRWEELLREEKEAKQKEELESKRENISRIAKMVDNKEKLSFNDLKILFEEGFDNDKLAQQVRSQLGIDVDVLKSLLNKN